MNSKSTATYFQWMLITTFLDNFQIATYNCIASAKYTTDPLFS